MRFCPECGAPVVAGAKFCVECGQQLTQAQPLTEGPPAQAGPRRRFSTPFALVFAAIVVVGSLAAYLIGRGGPAPQPASTTNAETGGGEQNLPPGHPKVELPAEARKLIDDLRRKAEANPKDVTAWNQLGEAAFRAAQFDRGFLGESMDAFGHVLKLDPENLEALRGVGNVNYDRGTYDQAIAAYEHYLKKKPGDPEVRTDLGTMYLYTGNADQALVQYKKVLAEKPGFFEAYFNMGVCYIRLNDPAKARESFDRAIKLAPDDETRKHVKEAIARVSGAAAPAASEQASAGAPAADASNGAAAPATTFEGAIENMVRGLNIMGPKVTSVEWPAKRKALVLLDQFPMDEMPPNAKKKFLDDIKNGIAKAKTQYKVDGTVELDIADAATRKTMETVTE